LARDEPEPDAAEVAWLTAILATAYAPEGAAQALLPGAVSFESVVREFGGRLVAQSVQFFFWSGGRPGDRQLTAADLTDPAAVRHLAEAMGADIPEEELDACHQSWNANAAQGQAPAPEPESIEGEGVPAGDREPEPSAWDYADLAEYRRDYERWALAELARQGRSGEPGALEKIRKLAGQYAAFVTDERRRARQREAELETWKVTVGEKTWRRWEEARAEAVRYAEMGLPVVPLWGLDEAGLCACTNARWAQHPKASCTAPAKHPAKGYQEAASCDPAQVAQMFELDTKIIDGDLAPVPGVGIVLDRDGCIELDDDPRHGGDKSLAVLEERLGPLPPTLTVGTPRGGKHRIYLDPRRRNPELYLKAGEVAPGVDLVTNGQATPMPPTVTVHGEYVQFDGCTPVELPASWAGDLAKEPPRIRPASERRPVGKAVKASTGQAAYVRTAIRDETAKLAAVTSGRNSALNDAACRMGSLAGALAEIGLGGLLPAELAAEHLLGACEDNGYLAEDGPSAAGSTFWSGWHGGLAEPRELPEWFVASGGTSRRHASIPRLRVAPPADLDAYADGVVQEVTGPIREAAEAVWPEDPDAEDAEWGDMKAVMDLVEPTAEALGGLGDLDLIDYDPARSLLHRAALPREYQETLDPDARGFAEVIFHGRLLDGWNKGAAAGHEVPAGLQAALDSWHPPCPIPPADIEERRLPPGREGAWPVRNFLSNSDDRGNARRLLDHYGDRILFTHAPTGLGEYAFDGQRWLDTASGGRGLAAEYADRTIESLPVTEAMSLSVAVTGFDKEGNPVSDRGRYWKWLNTQQSTARRSAMIHGAAALPGMRADVSVFDADPRWLNTPSGEVDQGRAEVLGDGTWRVADPVIFTGQHFAEHCHTRITAARYEPAATCPEWEQAMLDWLGDEELVRFTGKLVAASVRGLVTLKLLIVLLGGRNSGKTTFLEVLMAVLGGYATTAQPSILRKGNRGGSTLSDDLDDLRGFRLVTTTETSGAEQMDEPRVKRLSGGDRVRARGLYRSSAEWDPLFILWLATNAVPRMSGDDAALWGRLQPVRFPYLFTPTGKTPDGMPCKRADPTLKDRLAAEAPGILAWIIRHLELLYQEGLPEPEAVARERSELQRQQDTVGQFIAAVRADSDQAAGDSGADGVWAAVVTAHADLKIRFTHLFKHYVGWAKAHEITPVGPHSFRESLENHTIKTTRPKNVENVHGFGHRPSGLAGCPVCGEA
jgi:P4 family phage/plasmid primase-like protien